MVTAQTTTANLEEKEKNLLELAQRSGYATQESIKNLNLLFDLVRDDKESAMLALKHRHILHTFRYERPSDDIPLQEGRVRMPMFYISEQIIRHHREAAEAIMQNPEKIGIRGTLLSEIGRRYTIRLEPKIQTKE